mmetsp:Transcript_11814/g.15380  ORF Transcript_11814/g.15380 Transcript_11814/m.15380 type:complete len:259 (-) Transcript_11814:1120-1896(-)|eukprot:CAMPEP_0204862532 /NCGR_PEP_ID=MMETSP1348-20121228/2599_1 /ASSEMBLY_ACC=CAM_ASM_000700 /TAXON_ID=215587 /ORGANISM="Aplanochytrium stocchinoi, Strain GSBS06" /LENGTH=258 /DNA_ID=CAMNT_0052012523 /DNA_START=130 /DNA_END=906 /DNA_ORIENTATION=-
MLGLGRHNRHTVTVKTLDENFRMDLTPSETVKELQSRLVRDFLKEKATGKKIRLIYMGKVIKDDDVVASVVKNDSVVHCVMSDLPKLDSNFGNNNVNYPPAEVIPIDMDTLLDNDREFALRLSRLESALSDADDHSDESFSSDEESNRRDRLFERIQARIRRRRSRNDDSSHNVYQNFVLGFALGFFFGIFMLLYVRFYNNRTKKEMNLGIVCGVCANALYTISRNSGMLQEEDIEKKYYKEEDEMFTLIPETEQDGG